MLGSALAASVVFWILDRAGGLPGCWGESHLLAPCLPSCLLWVPWGLSAAGVTAASELGGL